MKAILPRTAMLALPLALSFAMPAFAGQVTVTPLAGYRFYDDTLDKLDPPGLDNSLIYGGALGYNFTPHWSAELDYLHTGPDRSNTSGSGNENNFDLNGFYRFNADGRVQPYLLLGAGQQHLKVDNIGSTRDAVINAGAGLFYRINDALRLRGELRAVNDTDHHYSDGVALVGLEFSLGGGDHAAPVMAAPTPAPAPAPEPRPAPRPVAHHVEPAAAPAPAPLDSDGDGVPDSIDKCPGTPAGAIVDQYGCPVVITEAIKQEIKVLFDNGKSVIKPEFKDEVKKVADLARQYPTAHIEIQGYTDNTGKPAKNRALSQARADAVRDSLVHDFGVDAGRLSTKGYGAANPVADNKTADGRARNRRVIAVISGERKQVEMKKVHHH